MEIKSNKINNANAEISAIISINELNKNIELIAKNLAKTTTIQGFRKGKVPVAIVKKQFATKLTEDAEAEALREVLSTGLGEMNISSDSLIGEPNVSKFDKDDEKIDVTIKIAMRPEIDLGDYASMVEEFDKPTIDEKDINEKIIELAQSQAKLVDIQTDRPMELGDTAVIDFEGYVDGKAFDGGKGEDFPLLLGSGQFIPGFEDQLVGTNKGDELTVKVTFPQEYGSEALDGKEAEFKVKVNQVQVREEIEINEELAVKMLPNQDDTSLEALKNQVKTLLENEKITKLYNDDLKPVLLESLVESVAFDLPEFVVEQEIDMALNKSASSMNEDEIQELRENVDKLDELRETFRADSERSVRATFIIDSLAVAENIQVDENEVMQTIYYEAMQTGQDPQKAYEHYKEAGYIPAIQMSMVEDKVLSTILNTKMKEA